MPANIHKEFTEFTPKGQEFIKLWNNEWNDGAQIRLAKHFGMSVPTVYRIRKKLGLPNLMETPARKKWEKHVVKNYLNKEWSTLRLAEIYKMSSQNINMVLRKHNVELRPQNVVNCAYYKTRQLDYSPAKLLYEIKRLYVDEKMTVVGVAKKLGIDPSAVSNKLKAMHIEIVRQNHNYIKGGYPCEWCGNIMEKVWQNKGKRKQKFCDGACKNKAKDLRRMLKGQRRSETRLERMLGELKDNWPNQFDEAQDRLMDVKPIMKLEPTPIDQQKLDLKEEWMKKWKRNSTVQTVDTKLN